MTTAMEIVRAIQAAYNAPAWGSREMEAREHRAMAAGCLLVPDLSVAQSLAIARGRATLRERNGVVTFHDVVCVVCRGIGCATCGGDGYSPPI